MNEEPERLSSRHMGKRWMKDFYCVGHRRKAVAELGNEGHDVCLGRRRGGQSLPQAATGIR